MSTKASDTKSHPALTLAMTVAALGASLGACKGKADDAPVAPAGSGAEATLSLGQVVLPGATVQDKHLPGTAEQFKLAPGATVQDKHLPGSAGQVKLAPGSTQPR